MFKFVTRRREHADGFNDEVVDVQQLKCQTNRENNQNAIKLSAVEPWSFRRESSPWAAARSLAACIFQRAIKWNEARENLFA